jgi:hypothetical protein
MRQDIGGPQRIELTHPDLVAELHPERNAGLTHYGLPVDPRQLLPGSNKRIWWKCPKGEDHEWSVAVSDRTTSDTGCPFCKNKKPSVTNSLASLYPYLAKEWHPKKNGTLLPVNVVAVSQKMRWWLCSRDSSHVWQASPKNRVNGTRTGRSCPVCFRNDGRPTDRPDIGGPQRIEITQPDLVAEIHPERNTDLTHYGVPVDPRQLLPNSNKKIWWKCPCGPDHEWLATVASRTQEGRKCPFCRNQKASVTNSLAALHPEIAKEWHPTMNGEVRPEDVVALSAIARWWKCPNGLDHEWPTAPGHRVRGRGCPMCANRTAHIGNRLDLHHPKLVEEYDATRNPPIESVAAKSNKKVWWVCSTCQHEWEAPPSNRTNVGSGCPQCECLVVHSDGYTGSFQSVAPEEVLEQFLSELNPGVTLTTFRPSAGKPMIRWKCQDCSTEWDATPNSRIDSEGVIQSRCPSCVGSGGFDQGQPGYLYSMKIHNEGELWWWKCGVSYHPSTRRRQIEHSLREEGMPLRVDIHSLIHFESGAEALRLENHLLEMKEHRVRIVESFSGSTELFSQDPIQIALELGLVSPDQVEYGKDVDFIEGS